MSTTDTTTETTTPAPRTPAEDLALRAAKDAAWLAYRGCPLDDENKAELLRLYSEAAEAADRATTERLIAESKADKARDAAARRLADARAALAVAEAEAEAASAAFRALTNDRRELQRLIAIHNVDASERRRRAAK